MIADEIKKAGQASIDQCTDLVTCKLTDTWTAYSRIDLEGFGLGALACNTGGSYWHDDDFGEWKITFTQDVCRYNGTPVKLFEYVNHGNGDYSSYDVYDFANNRIYYSEESYPTGFTVRGIEFQNDKQSFQILSSGQPSYTDNYSEKDSYSEAGLFNTRFVPAKPSCSSAYWRYLTDVSHGEGKKTLRTFYSDSTCRMLMINAVNSSDYNWSSGSPANGEVYVDIYQSGSSTIINERYARFTYYNPGNLMVILQPNQVAKVSIENVDMVQTIYVLCTIQEIIL